MPDADFDKIALSIDGASCRPAMTTDELHRGSPHCSGRFLFFV
jgi:hypothetical protein